MLTRIELNRYLRYSYFLKLTDYEKEVLIAAIKADELAIRLEADEENPLFEKEMAFRHALAHDAREVAIRLGRIAKLVLGHYDRKILSLVNEELETAKLIGTKMDNIP